MRSFNQILGGLAAVCVLQSTVAGANREIPSDLFRGESAEMRMVVVGQALIDFDLRTHAESAFLEARGYLGGADVTFTNLETAVMGRHGGTPIKPSVHYAPPTVLDGLKEMGFNALSLANNHAGDIGPNGILSAVEEAQARGFAVAGAGATRAAAAAPGLIQTPKGRVAVLAYASGALPADGGATDTRPGVNELRMGPNERYQADDVARAQAAIKAAKASAEYVLVYLHNHHWASDPNVTPEWVKAFARESVDNGASLFVTHGIPMVQGIEIYKGAPIFYGLGNFIFHSYSEPGGWFPGSWESVVAYCTFAGGRVRSVSFRPIVIREVGDAGENFKSTRGHPRLAQGDKARAILHRLEFISKSFGTRMEVGEEKARVVLP